MCGICGSFDYRRRRPVDRDLLQRMNDAMVHRGPDDGGVFVADGVGLAMRRLSIIDVSGGHQPLANEREDAWIVFNGEIYNFEALRRELEQRGHRFRTRTDTEVVLHLYEEHGEECLQLLDGMFAFAIWDARRGPGNERLVLARDRHGKKPLYLHDREGTLSFASEITPLLRNPAVSKELDPEAIHHYLSLLYVPGELSIFRSIRKLPAGHVMVCDQAGARCRPWWSFQEHLHDERAPEDVLIELRGLLFRAVEKRLVSEVPLGAFLSGGLDSSVVVAIMSRLMDRPVKTFSVGFEGPATHNELPMARLVAEHCKTDHHEIMLRPDIVRLLPDLACQGGEPFAISSAIPTYLLAKAARRDITVVLTGDGGDELFGGYEHYNYDRWARAYRHLPSIADGVVGGTARVLGGRVESRLGRLRTYAQRFVANARRPLGARRLGWMDAYTEDEKRALYDRNWPGRHAPSTADWLDAKVEARTRRLPSEAQVNALDVVVRLPDEMLVKVDRMTMAASVEARCPLLDAALTDYLARISFRDKIPGVRSGSLKSLLRRAVGDLLPPTPRDRRKWGFNVPLDHWFRNEARAFVEDTLSEVNVKRRGVFDPTAVRVLVAAHLAGRLNAGNRLYSLLVFHVWADIASV